MISTTHDQLINVIYKIENCYYHYNSDPFCGCNVKKENRKKKRNTNEGRNQNKFKKKKRNRNQSQNQIHYGIQNRKSIRELITKYLNSSKNTIENECCCEIHNECELNFKASYQTGGCVRHICLYLQENLSNLQLVVVIFLLALVTITAHSIDTQMKPQRKLSSKTSSTDAISMSVTNLTNSIKQPCYYVPNVLSARACRDADLLFLKSTICPKFSSIHRHFHGKRHLQSNTRKILENLNPLKSQIARQRNSSRNERTINIIGKNHHQLRNRNQDHHHHNQHHQQHYHRHHVEHATNYDFDTRAIKFGSNLPKENLRKINNTTSNKFLQYILTQNYFNTSSRNKNDTNNTDSINNDSNNNNNINNNISNDTLPVNVFNHKEIEDENANFRLNDVPLADLSHIDINNSLTSLKLLPLVTTTSTDITTTTAETEKNSSFLQTFIHTVQNHRNRRHQYHQYQQHIDHKKLMKLVMDGLGLEKAPNMKTVNISQKEYATKYREYLQRVHIRKRRELRTDLRDYDESLLKPLQFYSIISNNTLLNRYENSYKDFGFLRDKRDTQDSSNINDQLDQFDAELSSEGNQSLDKQVKSILFLRKKYQKPRSTKTERDERKTNIRLMFALKPEILNLSSSDIEEANIRLVLIHSPILAVRNSRNKKFHTKPKNNSCGSDRSEIPKYLHKLNVLNLKLYFLPRAGKRVLLDGRKVNIHVDLTKPDETHTQWLQFDVTKAVGTTIDDKRLKHVVLELQCDNCKRIGARILNDAYDTAADAQIDDPSTEGYQLMPVLNIIGRLEQTKRSMRPHKYDRYNNDNYEESTTQRHYHHQTNNNNKNRHNRRTNCYKANQRCCRHSMEVTFKEIKGFEFIIQPKVFDAGYCHGRCPPRYNPAHHHAMLQSLIWKQNHQKAPRPCCAPSKLVELEVLHVDEKDSEKLKISTWSDMKVVECACS